MNTTDMLIEDATYGITPAFVDMVNAPGIRGQRAAHVLMQIIAQYQVRPSQRLERGGKRWLKINARQWWEWERLTAQQWRDAAALLERLCYIERRPAPYLLLRPHYPLLTWMYEWVCENPQPAHDHDDYPQWQIQWTRRWQTGRVKHGCPTVGEPQPQTQTRM